MTGVEPSLGHMYPAVWIPQLDAIEQRLLAIEETQAAILAQLVRQEVVMSLDFAQITQRVEESAGVDQSIMTLLTDVAQQIRDSRGDQAKLDDLATQLESQAQAVSAAVQANSDVATPSTPTPPPDNPPDNPPVDNG